MRVRAQCDRAPCARFFSLTLFDRRHTLNVAPPRLLLFVAAATIVVVARPVRYGWHSHYIKALY